MENLRLRDMVTVDTYCNYELDEALDSDLFDLSIAELPKSKYWFYENANKLGDHKILQVDEWVIVCSEKDNTIKALLSVYELHGSEVIPEKDMIAVYGHEAIVLYFADGFSKEIRTR